MARLSRFEMLLKTLVLYRHAHDDAHSAACVSCMQDKEAKVAYLTKIISVVSMVLREPVPAKPLKIVAGLEPENTNIFLQMLGAACKQGTAAEEVKRVLAGDTSISAPTAKAAPASVEPEVVAEKPKSKPRSSKPVVVESVGDDGDGVAVVEQKSKSRSSKESSRKAADEPPSPPLPAPEEKKKSKSSSSAARPKPKGKIRHPRGIHTFPHLRDPLIPLLFPSPSLFPSPLLVIIYYNKPSPARKASSVVLCLFILILHFVSSS